VRQSVREAALPVGQNHGQIAARGVGRNGIAGMLLLAKTAMPHEQPSFLRAIDEQMAHVRPHAVLVELALLLIQGEQDTRNDVFRDRNIIGDALFTGRLKIA
jgi:hypothetical protein